MNDNDNEIQRVFDALLIKARAEGRRAPSVVAVASRAGISRSSMYRFHAEVVARIQALSGSKRQVSQDGLHAKVRLLAQQLKAERELTKALARACAELAAEKCEMSEHLEEERLRFSLRLESLQKKPKIVNSARFADVNRSAKHHG